MEWNLHSVMLRSFYDIQINNFFFQCAWWFLFESFFVLSLGVSQWTPKNVSNSLMFIGSNSVFSVMPGFPLCRIEVILWCIWEVWGWESACHFYDFQVCEKKIGWVCFPWEPTTGLVCSPFWEFVWYKG